MTYEMPGEAAVRPRPNGLWSILLFWMLRQIVKLKGAVLVPMQAKPAKPGATARLAEALNLVPDATGEEMPKALTAHLKAPAPPEPAKFVPGATVQVMLPKRNLSIATRKFSTAVRAGAARSKR